MSRRDFARRAALAAATAAVVPSNLLGEPSTTTGPALRAVRVRSVLQKKTDEVFGEFDVLAAAALPITATPLETNLETELSFPDPLGGIGNLCGLPTISVPCGFSDNKRVGLQFVARVRNDRAVVAAAHLFQQHTDWHTRRPPIA